MVNSKHCVIVHSPWFEQLFITLSGWQQPWQKWTLNSLTIIILPLQCNALLCYVMCVCHWCYQGVFQEINILTNRAHLVDVNSILTHTKNLISCCFQVSNSNFTIFNVDGHVLPSTKWPYGSWWFSPKYVHHQWWSIIVSPRTKSKLPSTASSLSSPSSSSL